MVDEYKLQVTHTMGHSQALRNLGKGRALMCNTNQNMPRENRQKGHDILVGLIEPL